MTTKYKLDPEAKEILKDLKSGKYKRVPDYEKRRSIAIEAAKAFKSSRLTMRIQPQILNDMKTIATNEGLQYQSLISSILHKYIAHYNKAHHKNSK